MTPRYLQRYRDSLPKKPKQPSCPYASTLRRMPPLCHQPNTDRFYISHSEPVRFILHLMGGKTGLQKDWSRATTLFNQAGKSRVIVFDRETRKWQGCEYKPTSVCPKIRKLLRATKIRDKHPG